MIGYAICGSFCTHAESLKALFELAKRYDVLPILSPAASTTDTRFGTANELIEGVTAICGRPPILTVKDAEPLGPKTPLDALIIAPCTGNTLAKLAHAVTDTSVTMAAKAHLRNGGRLIIALASNDALGANLCNLGALTVRKNVYFVPMLQDDPVKKPCSLVADFTRIPDALAAASDGRQLRPMFV